MSDDYSLAASILAAAAFRQEQAVQGSGILQAKDAKAEIWRNYEFFMDKISGGTRFVSRLIADESVD